MVESILLTLFQVWGCGVVFVLVAHIVTSLVVAKSQQASAWDWATVAIFWPLAVGVLVVLCWSWIRATIDLAVLRSRRKQR